MEVELVDPVPNQEVFVIYSASNYLGESCHHPKLKSWRRWIQQLLLGLVEAVAVVEDLLRIERPGRTREHLQGEVEFQQT
jgi:hypothetical protein